MTNQPESCPPQGTQDKHNEIYEQAVEKWGVELQLTMWHEESAELSKLLCKFARGKFNGETQGQIAEELADVQIMLEQLQVMFKVTDEGLDFWKQKKLKRLEKMLNDKPREAQ